MSEQAATAALVTRYADRLHATLVDGSHTVTSPLGAWLLLALVAPAATGEVRGRLEAVIGTDVDDAHARALALLGDPHPAVAAAAAVWARRERMLATFDAWAARLGDAVTVGAVPTQGDADAWAAEHTLGLIPHFPTQLDDDTIVVLANALATRVRWERPFDRVPSALLGGPWAESVGTVLSSDPAHRIRILRTDAAGEVACHEARSHDGLRVCTVIAARTVAPDRVLAAAHGCCAGDATEVSLFDLPLGDGPAWTIREAPAVRPEAREHFHAWLPAWTASADHASSGTASTASPTGSTCWRPCARPTSSSPGAPARSPSPPTAPRASRPRRSP